MHFAYIGAILMGFSIAVLAKPALVFVGAGTGGLLRYWLGGIIQHWLAQPFPLGTLTVNVSGCFAMGFLATAIADEAIFHDEYRMVVLIGLLGGYTTFSTFGYETLVLIRAADWTRVGLYVFGSVILSLLAVWIGAMLADKLFGPSVP
jgi:fluoride exporter